ncbi:hypothetical protein [Streptomyces sp. NPDC059994]|uniref:hypothetical protein n=1 Tax=Streptomyces sp. NPDC059994 TaxID=3347029 RepID=UPI003675A941
MTYRPYPNVDRALRQLDRHECAIPDRRPVSLGESFATVAAGLDAPEARARWRRLGESMASLTRPRATA